MAFYKIEFKPRAIKQLRSLPQGIISKVSEHIDRLALEPYPTGCKKLEGAEHTYRIRIGDYRVVYTIFNDKLIVQVIKIGHRKDVYR